MLAGRNTYILPTSQISNSETNIQLPIKIIVYQTVIGKALVYRAMTNFNEYGRPEHVESLFAIGVISGVIAFVS